MDEGWESEYIGFKSIGTWWGTQIVGFFFFLRFNDSVRQRRQDTGELKYNLPILFRGSDYRGRCFSLAVFWDDHFITCYGWFVSLSLFRSLHLFICCCCFWHSCLVRCSLQICEIKTVFLKLHFPSLSVSFLKKN